MELVEEAYMIFVVDALHIEATNIFHDGGKLLVNMRAQRFCLIFMSCTDNQEIMFSYAFKWVVIESECFICRW